MPDLSPEPGGAGAAEQAASPTVPTAPTIQENSTMSNEPTSLHVKDVRQFKGQIGGTVRMGVHPSHGYVDVSVRVSETDPRVAVHLKGLRAALAEIATEAIAGAK